MVRDVAQGVGRKRGKAAASGSGETADTAVVTIDDARRSKNRRKVHERREVKARVELLAQVPSDGTTIGNGSLRESLGWDLDTYQAVRDELVARGVIRLGPGRGGTVSLVEPRSPVAPTRAASRRRPERELYAAVGRGLAKWASNQGWSDHFVEQTAHQGSKKTGGKLTRPDFVVIGFRCYEYTPGKIRDVETIEVKLWPCGIEAVFEAAAHSRWATRSHLAIKRSRSHGPTAEDLARLEAECQRFGVGLILFDDPETPDAWVYRIEPARQEPDPELLEEFLNTQVKGREQLRKWLH